jgi:uncharacterized protein with PQ loop repeat
MNTIEIIYIVGVMVAICAGLPQIIQLVKSKASDEFSVPTWGMWLVTQCSSLAYAISISNAILVGVNLAWMSFYLIMISLILWYRRRPAYELVVLDEQETRS